MLNLYRQLRTRRATRFDLVGVGECSMDEVWLLPGPLPPGGKVGALRYERLGGGQIATALVAATRLGLRTAFVGAVGDDAAGAEVRRGLAEEAVDVSGLRTIPGARTRTALIVVDGGSGERSIAEVADPALQLREVVLASCRVVHLDATQIHLSLAAARQARADGALVSLDVDRVSDGLDELLRLTDICITSEHLPSELTGERNRERALLRLRERTGPLVICTLGAGGAVLVEEGGLVQLPAVAVPVVDTTACGDTFRAAVLSALLEGKSAREAVHFGNLAAALKCRDLGRRGCPTRAEVDAFAYHVR